MARRGPLVQVDGHLTGTVQRDGERGQGGVQPAVGEDRPGGCRGPGRAAPEARASPRRAPRRPSPPRRVGVLQQLLLRQAEPHGEGDEPGLCAVVQIALDAPQVGRGRVDDRRPGPTPARRSAAPVRRTARAGRAPSPGPRWSARARSTAAPATATNSEASVTAKVRTPQGSRMDAYSACRQPTGSFSPATAGGGSRRSRRPAAGSARPPAPRAAPGPAPASSCPNIRHAPSAGRQQRQPDHGDGQPRPERQPDHQHQEPGEAQREIGQQVRDLPPRRAAERPSGRRQ